MSLLTRGIGSTGQGLSYMDKAIQKFEQDKKELETNTAQYQSQLMGIESSGTFFGEKSRTILNEYARAFEDAIDMYSADPSQENKAMVDNIKLQTLDFYNRAVASRQNNLTTFQAVTQNPNDYQMTLEQAQAEFASREDQGVGARYDVESGQMLVDNGSGFTLLGNDGHYNGEDPLFYATRTRIGAIKVPGEWATSQKARLLPSINEREVKDDEGNIITRSGFDRGVEDFVETNLAANSPYQETAIYNYLQHKGYNLEEMTGEEGARRLEALIVETKENPEKLMEALTFQGQKEMAYLSGVASHEAMKATAVRRAEVFSGQVEFRGDREVAFPGTSSLVGGVPIVNTPLDEFLGARSVNRFVSDLNGSQIAGLKTKNLDGIIEVLKGMNMDAEGNMVLEILVETPAQDETEESTFKQEFRVVKPGSELYENVVSHVGNNDIIGAMINKSIQTKALVEEERNNSAIRGLYERSQLEVPPQYVLPTAYEISKAQEVDRDKGKTGPKGFERGLTKSTVESEAGLISKSPLSDGPLQEVTRSERAMDRRLREAIREANPDLSNEEFNRVIAEMNAQNLTVTLSPTRYWFQTILGRPKADIMRGVETFNKVLASLKERDELSKLDEETQAYRDQFEQLRGRNYKDNRLSDVEGSYGRGLSKDYLYSILPEKNKEDYDNKGGVAVLTNNPGNLRPYLGYTGPVYYNKDNPKDAFRVFDNPQDGLEALNKDVTKKVAGRGEIKKRMEAGNLPSKAKSAEDLTIFDIISVYAPASENNPRIYSRAIANFAKEKGYPEVTADSPASSLPIDVLVEAIIKVESGQNHRRLTAQGLFDTPSGGAGRA